MQFSISREALLKPLQMVIGVVERKQTMPILSHILLITSKKQLTFIGTDTEVELRGLINMEGSSDTATSITLPGKKLLDICRMLPENSLINLTEEQGRVTLSCGRSRFTMASLPAKDFPCSPEQATVMTLEISQESLRELIEKTSFAIPQQDVRQYLNGLLFEIKKGSIQTLSTDGHRLAVHSITSPAVDNSFAQVIIPRKAVFELLRLLENSTTAAHISFNNNFVKIQGENFVVISKLISGKFPNYNKIIPKRGNKKIELDRNELKQALTRVGILSNELFRSVHFRLKPKTLVLAANNPEQEEAIEEISIDYQEEELDIIFNISYFVDILNIIETEKVTIFLNNSESGIIIEEAGDKSNCLFVLMPIRQ